MGHSEKPTFQADLANDDCLIDPANDTLVIVTADHESGGFGIRTAIPERDGVLSGLLLAEAIVTPGRQAPRPGR